MSSPVPTPGTGPNPVPIDRRWRTDEGFIWKVTKEPAKARDRSRKG